MVYFFHAGVLLSIEKAKFWRIWNILLQNFALIGVLLQVRIMRWCTKIEEYQVCLTMVNIWVGPYLLYICKSQLMALNITPFCWPLTMIKLQGIQVWRKIFWLVCFVSDWIGMKSTRKAVKQEDRQELGQISELVQAEMICKIFIMLYYLLWRLWLLLG